MAGGVHMFRREWPPGTHISKRRVLKAKIALAGEERTCVRAGEVSWLGDGWKAAREAHVRCRCGRTAPSSCAVSRSPSDISGSSSVRLHMSAGRTRRPWGAPPRPATVPQPPPTARAASRASLLSPCRARRTTGSSLRLLVALDSGAPAAGGGRPGGDGPAGPDRAQSRRRRGGRVPRLDPRRSFDRHAEWRRRRDRGQVRVQPEAHRKVSSGSSIYLADRRSCALTGTSASKSDVAARDERPAAAAAASRWPMFALREAHCTDVRPPADRTKALSAAPTYG